MRGVWNVQWTGNNRQARGLMAANDNEADDASLRRGQKLLSSRLGRDVSEEEARRMGADLIGFFKVLAEWARAEQPAAANDNCSAMEEDRGQGDEG